MQVVNVLNGELSGPAAHALMEAALSTLTALIVGSDAQRLRLRCDVGYDALHDVLASQVRCFSLHGTDQAKMLIRISSNVQKVGQTITPMNAGILASNSALDAGIPAEITYDKNLSWLFMVPNVSLQDMSMLATQWP